MWLIAFLHIFIGSTLAGSFVIAVLSMGLTTPAHIIIAAVLGFVAGLPVSWFVAQKIRELK